MSLNITVKSEDSESFDEEDESSPLLSVKRGSESAARHDISPGEGGPIEDHAGYSTQHGRLATKTTSKPIVLCKLLVLYNQTDVAYFSVLSHRIFYFRTTIR
jgi:hypothetical protein